MYDIVIGIIHHSRIDLTISCIESIYEPRLKIKICLVDNNPQERIQQEIVSKFPHVDFIVNIHSQGFGFNQNMIMQRYKGKYHAFMSLNNDTIVKSNAIFLLNNYLFKDASIGAVCPQMVDKYNNPQTSNGPLPNAMIHILRIINLKTILKVKIVKNILYRYIRLFPNSIQQYLEAKNGRTLTRQISRISGACVLFKEKAILSVGGYDERFYMYSEDSDWSIRAKNKGFLLYIVTPAKVMHHVGASGAIKTKIELEKSMFLYIATHQPRFKRIAILSVAFVLVFSHVLQYVFCLLSLRGSQDKTIHRKIILLGLRKITKPI
jgi:GT2 family glycosyltransferase